MGLDLLWTGIVGGSLAYGIYRLRRGAQMSGELHAYVLLVLVGFLPNEIWRMLGLVVARGIDEESEFFMWARAVAIAVLAGVIAKIIVLPPGTLAGVPLGIRLGAIACGFVAFLAGAPVGVRGRGRRGDRAHPRRARLRDLKLRATPQGGRARKPHQRPWTRRLSARSPPNRCCPRCMSLQSRSTRILPPMSRQRRQKAKSSDR